MKNYQEFKRGPKDVAPSKAPNAKAQQAFASIDPYNRLQRRRKEKRKGGSEQELAHSTRARICEESSERHERNSSSYRASDGRTWRYKGKKARVLELLAEEGRSLTQHDTYPWHTRLGGTIHAMRRDGLDISTELEGPYRHARYRLRTPGALTRESGAKGGPVSQHRATA